MPIATIMVESERFDLKSAPPDGYVVVKRMTYGQKLRRSEMTSKMKMLISKGNRDVEAEIDLLHRSIALWEFANLIVDHNLTDASGRKLNFANVADVEMIDGRVGEEINTRIAELNNFEEELEDSTSELGK